MCYHPGMTVGTVTYNIDQVYDLDDAVSDRLTFTYVTHSKIGKKSRKVVRLGAKQCDEKMLENRSYNDANGQSHTLTIADLELSVKVDAGTEREVDISCDSTFMMGIIKEIGESIRRKFHWVPIEKPVHLFIDNAGGHGTEEAKDNYVKWLETEYNVKVIWQVPNSPETNLLDLGVWRTIQSLVEKVHRQKVMQADVLSESVEEAWATFDSIKMAKVATCWAKVLRLIIKGNGANNLVESERGLTGRPSIVNDDPIPPTEPPGDGAAIDVSEQQAEGKIAM